MSEFKESELIELAEGAIEGTLGDEQIARLEDLVLHFPKAANLYAKYVSIHAAFRATQGESFEFAKQVDRSSIVDRTWSRTSVGSWNFMSLAVVASVLFLSVGIGSWLILNRSRPTIATIVDTKGCTWDAGTLPTEVGATLTSGRMRLATGLVQIRFANGVEVRLEAPADLELISSMKCIMHAGQLIARVPPNAKGFVVETPSSIITDYGTEFGVSIGKDDSAVVQVFEGRVDTFHRATKKTESMLKGKSMQFNATDYLPHLNEEQSVQGFDGQRQTAHNEKWLQLTTAQGRGRDAFVQAMEIPSDRRSESLLLVKRPIQGADQWERRVYLGFDLRELSEKTMNKVELSLTFSPTGFGFASLLPDATFRVYGLVEESLDEWVEADLDWENAPANRLPREPLNETLVKELGSFVLQQGDQSTTVHLTDERLTQFLQSDTNQFATLILLRETEGMVAGDLVHGIVSRRHPTLPPPTLRVRCSNE